MRISEALSYAIPKARSVEPGIQSGVPFFAPPVVVLGDSQTRSVTYHRSMLPLFVGPASMNNFITSKRAEKLTAKLLDIVDRLGSCTHYLMLFSGDVILNVRDTYQTRGADPKKALSEAVGRYVAAAVCMQKNTQGRVVVASVLPMTEVGYEEESRFYNDLLKNHCSIEGLAFLDLWSALADASGHLREPYRANETHANHLVAGRVVEGLVRFGMLPKDSPPLSDFAWRYRYRIESPQGELKIWGDLPKRSLFLRPGEVYWWHAYPERFHQHTALTEECLAEIGLVMARLDENKVITDPFAWILNCREGFVPFSLPGNLFRSVLAMDPDATCINFAQALRPLYRKCPPVEFRVGTLTEGTARYAPDVILDLDGSDLLEEVRKENFEAFKTWTRFLFFRSVDAKTDRRLLHRAGFRNVLDLPIAPALFRDPETNVLLFATTEILPDTFLIWLRSRIAAYAENQVMLFQKKVLGYCEIAVQATAT